MRGWLERLDDRMNPIVVKELRQAVQGRFIAAVVVLFLAVEVIALALYIASNDGGDAWKTFGVRPIGSELFFLLESILLFVCIFFLPTYAAARLIAERSNRNLDLMFITTLSPRSIVSGKLWGALALALLVHSLCLPFMTLTYFLRGIDLPSIFAAMLLGLGVVATCIMSAIFLACLPLNRVFRVLLGLGGLFTLFSVYIYVLVGVYAVLEAGVGGRLDDPELWVAVGLSAFLTLATIGGLFVLSVACVSPSAANRAPAVRWFFTLAWGLGAAIVTATVLSDWSDADDLLEVWVYTVGLLVPLALLVAVSSPDVASLRVRSQIPASWLKRVVAFFTFSGAANGFFWALGLLLATLGLAVLLSEGWDVGRSKIPEAVAGNLILGLYSVAYTLSAMLLMRFTHRWAVHRGQTWIVALALVTIGSTVPLLIGFLVSPDQVLSSDTGLWILPNPFAAYSDKYRLHAGVFASVWALLALLFSARWLMAQVRNFKPPAPVVKPAQEPAVALAEAGEAPAEPHG